jgi:hypothetical protein
VRFKRAALFIVQNGQNACMGCGADCAECFVRLFTLPDVLFAGLFENGFDLSGLAFVEPQFLSQPGSGVAARAFVPVSVLWAGSPRLGDANDQAH